MIGVRPLFDGDAARERHRPRFEVIALDPTARAPPRKALTWTLERIEHRLPVVSQPTAAGTTRRSTPRHRVANGTIDISADRPARIEATVDWGRYRLDRRSATGDSAAATSVDFDAGWYVAANGARHAGRAEGRARQAASTTSATRPSCASTPRFAGIALVMVVDDRLIAMKSVEVPASAPTSTSTSPRDWGPGAYVTAVALPADGHRGEAHARPAPSASTWAKRRPGRPRAQCRRSTSPDEMRPRGRRSMSRLTIGNLPAGHARPTSPSPRSISASSTSPTSRRPIRTTSTSASASSAWRSATSTAC